MLSFIHVRRDISINDHVKSTELVDLGWLLAVVNEGFALLHDVGVEGVVVDCGVDHFRVGLVGNR